jgi:predicted transcriptional regulator
MLGGKRSDVAIALDILRLVRSGERKTRIMYGANLSYEMLTRYLDFLLERDFIAHDAEQGRYRLTDTGRVLIADLERVNRHFETPADDTAGPLLLPRRTS